MEEDIEWALTILESLPSIQSHFGAWTTGTLDEGYGTFGPIDGQSV